MTPQRRAADTGATRLHPNARQIVAEVFADVSPYYEPPDVPEGMTLDEWRRARWEALRDG